MAEMLTMSKELLILERGRYSKNIILGILATFLVALIAKFNRKFVYVMSIVIPGTPLLLFVAYYIYKIHITKKLTDKGVKISNQKLRDMRKDLDKIKVK